MKKRLDKICTFLVVIATLAPIIYAQSGSIQNPAGQLTLPQNSINGTLYDLSAAGQFDTNQIVTGNAGKGMSFRGEVPYQSTNNFNAALGTSNLSSHIRDSAGIEDADSYRVSGATSAAPYKSFYLPSQTVSSSLQNQTRTNGLYSPSANYVSDNAASIQNSTIIPQSWELYDIGITAQQTNNISSDRKINNSYNPQEQTDSSDSLVQRIQKQTTEIEKNQIDSQSLLNMQNNAGRSIIDNDIKGTDSLLSQMNYQAAGKVQGNLVEQPSNLDSDQIIARLQKQLDDLTKSIEERLDNDIDTHTALPEIPKSSGIEGRNRSNIINKSSEQQATNAANLPAHDYSNTKVNISENNPKQDKFDDHFQNGLEYLKSGFFKKASESFNIAAIYHPEDPLVCVNQAHSLFADRQYLNSALCLIRALELYPEYINEKVTMENITGNLEQFINNRTELEQLVELSDATGLRFLLCYVDYRSGRFNDAHRIITMLEPRMPKSTALLAIKLAVDANLRSQQNSAER
jgi:tetratricopeptide (TPR) repeat protein